VVVVGNAADQVIAALQGLPLTFVRNPNWESGQASSIAAGVDALPLQTGAAVFMVADQPLLPVGLLRSLVELHATQLAPIVAPLIDGQRGNPVLFDCRLFTALRSLSGDLGGRALFSRVQPVWLPWSDPAALMDVDTPEDYARLLADLNPEDVR
jgi:molybdenum cofactor cytidylyltransferase